MRSVFVPVFALTLLVSAALLFSIQPMFSKLILPILGGSPQVWTTAMVFFQVTLLAGYAYAHGTSKILPVKIQAPLHIVLLGLFAAFLPFGLPADLSISKDQNLSFWQLGIMLSTIGGPFFILSGSAPILQRWFANTDHPDADNPYFLYGASNLGSMASLLAYPFLIEPVWDLSQQSNGWMYGYFLLITFVCVCVALVLFVRQKGEEITSAPADDKPVTWKLRGYWLALSFAPSSLMLGVTTFITTDIASVPMIWIVPLAIYVGTFIVVFARKPILKPELIHFFTGVSMVVMVCQGLFVVAGSFSVMFIHLLTFTLATLSCHFELARAKPSPKHLTEFYLFMATGGALGGIFNALIATQFLYWPMEYIFAYILVALLKPDLARTTPIDDSFKKLLVMNALVSVALSVLVIVLGVYFANLFQILAIALALSLLFLTNYRQYFIPCFAIAIICTPPGFSWPYYLAGNTYYMARNFFGVIRVSDFNENEIMLLHGGTNHGTQSKLAEHKLTPLSYYGPTSPLRKVFNFYTPETGSPKEQNIAVVGLGVGVIACYTAPSRHYDFYEIDQDIIDIAENTDLFTYLSDCGSSYQTILGDGRLELSKAEEGKYDIILLDAFSSNNIPVHLLTKEAIETYLSKITDVGAVVFNVSNRYLDIEPIIGAAGKELDVYTYAAAGDEGRTPDGAHRYFQSHFAVVTRNEDLIRSLEQDGWTKTMKRAGVSIWTDKFSNIVSVLGNVSVQKRGQMIGERKRKAKEAQEKTKFPRPSFNDE